MARKLNSQKKRELQEEKDLLTGMGQESEKKAVKYVQEFGKLTEKKNKKKEEDALADLDGKRKYELTYKEAVLRYLHEMLRELSFPKLWQWGVWYDGRGIRLTIIDKKGLKYKRAFTPSHDPKYDLHACYRFARWAEEIVDIQEGVKNTKDLWTPIKELN